MQRNFNKLFNCTNVVFVKAVLEGKRIEIFVKWDEYILAKQTYKQLVLKYNCSVNTIQKRLYQV